MGFSWAGWVELADSQPLRQRWEKREGVVRPLVLTAELTFSGPPTPQGDQDMRLVATVETVDPVVPPRSSPRSAPGSGWAKP